MTYQRIFSSFVLCALVTTIVAGSGSDCWAKPVKKTEDSTRFSQSNSQTGAMGIAAVVGEQAISSFDVNSRIKFIVVTTGISNTPEMIANIRPQIIHTLINESLQMQEATQNNIVVSDKEVADAIAGIEVQRGIPSGGIKNMLATNNIPSKTFDDQIRAQLAWSKILTRTVRPRIKISDEEISLADGRITSTPVEKNNQNIITEIRISVINIPVDKPENEAKAKNFSDKLYVELHKKMNFEAAASQFSSGGDGKPFWIRPQQLDSNVAKSIRAIKEGAITKPIRTHDGFSIIKLFNVRTAKNNNNSKSKNNNVNKNTTHDVEITFKEILLKLKLTGDSKEAEVLLQIGEEISKNPGKCEDEGIASISGLDDFDIEVNLRKAPFSKLPPALRNISDGMKLGDMSMPFASAEGIHLYMLCGKKNIVDSLPINTDKIRESLFRQKFELEAQKYLRNLQREVFIEVRG
jgi:peptidyl-prolyl cis-trans isomerase SurA